MPGDQLAIDQRVQFAVAVFTHLTDAALTHGNFASMGAQGAADGAIFERGI